MIEKIIYVAMFFLTTFLFVISKVLFDLKARTIKWGNKLKSLRISRKGLSKKDFIRYFLDKGYNRKIIKFVYRKVQQYINAKGLVLLPEDDFRIIYEVDEDEWSYSLKDWFEDLKKPFPSLDYIFQLNDKYQKINFEYLMELFHNDEKIQSNALEAKLKQA